MEPFPQAGWVALLVLVSRGVLEELEQAEACTKAEKWPDRDQTEGCRDKVDQTGDSRESVVNLVLIDHPG